jgi:hypothetical protein
MKQYVNDAHDWQEWEKVHALPSMEDVHVLCIDAIRAHSVASVLILLPALTSTFSSTTGLNYFQRNRQNHNQTVVVWPIRRAVHCILSTYLFDFQSTIGDLLEHFKRNTSNDRRMTLLYASLETTCVHLHNTFGWSSSLIGEEEDEEEEESQVTKMCVGYIFWDHATIIDATTKTKLNKVLEGRSRCDVQHDAWCALELLSCSLPEMVFEIFVEQCVWDKYIKESVDVNVCRAAIALCGHMGRIALDRCDQDDGGIGPEEAGVQNPFVYPDGEARQGIVLRGTEIVKKLQCFVEQNDGFADVVKQTSRLLHTGTF